MLYIALDSRNWLRPFNSTRTSTCRMRFILHGRQNADFSLHIIHLARLLLNANTVGGHFMFDGWMHLQHLGHFPVSNVYDCVS